MKMIKKTILSCPSLQVETLIDLKEYIYELNKKGIGGYSVAINAEKIMMYRSNHEMRTSIDGSILPSPDGVAVVLGYKWLYGVQTLRVDLPNTILDLANEKKLRLFILGAKEEVNAKAAENIKEKFPSLVLAGRANGYFKNTEVLKEQLQKSRADFVLICMGSPKQEIMMTELREAIPKAILIGCGGALDVMSGQVKRAPMFYQNNGLEWFYRIMQRPSLIKRKWVYVPFMLLLIKATVKRFFTK
jgi:N-acetylglucosaminyldiphosphoundecaprenol N-acetyl-beta-D-mannosaminyltransferase